jgi:hypothetical protein
MFPFCCALFASVVFSLPSLAPPQEPGNAPLCARGIQGYVRLANGTAVSRAVVQQLVEPQQTLVFRVRTDRRGWFAFPGGQPKRNTHILLRISAPGVATTLVRLRIDASCGDPVITLVPASPAPETGGVR